MIKKSYNKDVRSVQYVPPSTRTCNVTVNDSYKDTEWEAYGIHDC